MRGMGIDLIVVGAAVAIIVLVTRWWFARTADLGLSLFHPWRGDPWPIGVQEEDEVHFDLRPPRPVRHPERLELVAVADGGVADADDAWAGPTILTEDEVEGLDSVALERARPERIEVRRPTR